MSKHCSLNALLRLSKGNSTISCIQLYHGKDFGKRRTSSLKIHSHPCYKQPSRAISSGTVLSKPPDYSSHDNQIVGKQDDNINQALHDEQTSQSITNLPIDELHESSNNVSHVPQESQNVSLKSTANNFAKDTEHAGASENTQNMINNNNKNPEKVGKTENIENESALSRRFSQLTEDALSIGGSTAARSIAQASFDSDLRKKLEDRIANAGFSISLDHQVLSQVEVQGLNRGARKSTLDIAGAKPWNGDEPVEDAALRMLVDAHRPLSGGRASKIPVTAVIPAVITRKSKSPASSGSRIASAKERSSMYASLKDQQGLSQDEKSQRLAEMRAQFTPLANNLPATLSGLASLANERIEEAIARGQFRNLPRGKKLEVDYNANSPFIDTTEYFMNKMIKKQDIVHPWIEKQQEINTAARRFRIRLRNDWKRHAARVISSKGGTLSEQIKRAEQYALAELNASSISSNSLSTQERKEPDALAPQISSSGELMIPQETNLASKTMTTSPSMTNNTTQTPSSYNDQQQQSPKPELQRQSQPHLQQQQQTQTHTQTQNQTQLQNQQQQQQQQPTPLTPFRDPAWEATEHPFHTLSITTLNSLMRTYNLMAPRPAQKPYFHLPRELRSCYADCAPQLAEVIRERAGRGRAKMDDVVDEKTREPSRALARLYVPSTRVHDENLRVKGYGFKEFWRDLWKGDGER